MQLYPSTFSHGTADDQWTRKDFSYDTDDPKELHRLGYNELKKHCYPAITYEVDGFVDADIGDTVKAYDDFQTLKPLKINYQTAYKRILRDYLRLLSHILLNYQRTMVLSLKIRSARV
ncbi:putative antireceptor [Streptococcus pneumoniae]|nr:putative antireceptor [Streptococcus pneumoniae]